MYTHHLDSCVILQTFTRADVLCFNNISIAIPTTTFNQTGVPLELIAVMYIFKYVSRFSPRRGSAQSLSRNVVVATFFPGLALLHWLHRYYSQSLFQSFTLLSFNA